MRKSVRSKQDQQARLLITCFMRFVIQSKQCIPSSKSGLLATLTLRARRMKPASQFFPVGLLVRCYISKRCDAQQQQHGLACPRVKVSARKVILNARQISSQLKPACSSASICAAITHVQITHKAVAAEQCNTYHRKEHNHSFVMR